jgi:hypothetical protein
MSRYRAALIHVLISAAVVAAILSIVFLIWYPGWTFRVAGAMDPVLIMVSVDIVLGPLLTLIIYKEGKPGLKFDLAFIATMQLIALVYGSNTLYGERPHYLVFAIDRVTLVAKKNVDESTISSELRAQDNLGHIVNVFARAPTDPAEFQRFLDGVLFEGQRDLDLRTEFWEPWLAGAQDIRAKARLLSEFEPAGELEKATIGDAMRRLGDVHPQLGLLPVGGIEDDIGLLIDIESLEILEVIEINPW